MTITMVMTNIMIVAKFKKKNVTSIMMIRMILIMISDSDVKQEP